MALSYQQVINRFIFFSTLALPQFVVDKSFFAISASYPDFARKRLGALGVVASPSVNTLATTSFATEILEGTLLTLEQLTARLIVLALNASRKPEESPRVRSLLEDLLADVQGREE
jgi:hypothetical protein